MAAEHQKDDDLLLKTQAAIEFFREYEQQSNQPGWMDPDNYFGLQARVIAKHFIVGHDGDVDTQAKRMMAVTVIIKALSHKALVFFMLAFSFEERLAGAVEAERLFRKQSKKN